MAATSNSARLLEIDLEGLWMGEALLLLGVVEKARWVPTGAAARCAFPGRSLSVV